LEDSIVKQPIHNFKVGQVIRIELTDDGLEPDQWFETAVKTISSDCVWIDLERVSIYYADGNFVELQAGFKVYVTKAYGAGATGLSVDDAGGKCWEDWTVTVSHA
jgi:hypothetical protein